jgi:hypothetical protein
MSQHPLAVAICGSGIEQIDSGAKSGFHDGLSLDGRDLAALVRNAVGESELNGPEPELADGWSAGHAVKRTS